MDKQTVLDLFDQEQRIEFEEIGVRREATADVVRYSNVEGSGVWILYAWLTEENIDRVINEQIVHFDTLGVNFEWKVYDHDWPPDMVDRLEARGFKADQAEALAFLDLQEAREDLFAPPRHDLRLLTSPEQIADVIRVHEQVWKRGFTWLGEELTYQMMHDSEHLQIYAVYVEDVPVSAAWVRFHEGTHFASLWGGSTLAEYRHRGIYHDLVGVRAAEARKRGYRYLTVDASPMSRPILEKLGFEVLSYSHPCVWEVGGSQRSDAH